MGKRRHNQDKMFITAKEHCQDWGGKSEASQRNKSNQMAKLPFHYCNLGLTATKDPYCTPDGIVFDLLTIIPALKKTKNINPLTGDPLTQTELTKLHFHKNEAGLYHCPLTFKPFNDNSKIIAVKETGNVYSYEAYKELNLDADWFHDLLDDTKFNPKHVITIQDPSKPPRQFSYKYKLEEQEESINKTGTHKRIMEMTSQTPGNQLSDLEKAHRALQDKDPNLFTGTKRQKIQTEVKCDFKLDPLIEPEAQDLLLDHKTFLLYRKSMKQNYSKRFSDGKAGASFTSQRLDQLTETSYKLLTDDEMCQEYWNIVKSKQQKAYVVLVTTLGPLKCEIHANLVPKTAENFVELCETKQYDKIEFHRVIAGFMAQGGDIDGKGGHSIFHESESFKDEFHESLRHNQKGVIAMANSGKDTNKSQFYITFVPTPHLDNKHTVFGQLMPDSLKILDQIERCSKKVKILETSVLANPFREAKALILKKEWEQMHKEHQASEVKKQLEQLKYNKYV